MALSDYGEPSTLAFKFCYTLVIYFNRTEKQTVIHSYKMISSDNQRGEEDTGWAMVFHHERTTKTAFISQK